MDDVQVWFGVKQSGKGSKIRVGLPGQLAFHDRGHPQLGALVGLAMLLVVILTLVVYKLTNRVAQEGGGTKAFFDVLCKRTFASKGVLYYAEFLVPTGSLIFHHSIRCVCSRIMEWNVLVSDADPWVMYRVFLAGLLYIYVPNTWTLLGVSYISSSLSYILSFGLEIMRGSMVHYMFTYPVAVLVGVFVSHAVAEKPSKYPALHVMAVLPWVAAGFYGPLGYPIFLFPYIVTLLIAGMHKWATVAGVSMLLNGILYPLHSPLISLSLPIVVLFAYSWFADIYHPLPFDPGV